MFGFKRKQSEKLYKVYEKTGDEKYAATVAKKPCFFYIIKNGKKVDTFDLTITDLVQVALANKNIDLSKITSEKQKINSYTKLKQIFFCRNFVSKKLFEKIIDQLGGTTYYINVLNVSKNFGMSIDNLLDNYIFSETNPIKSDAPKFAPPPIQTTKHVKLNIPPEVKNPQENKDNKDKKAKGREI